MRGLFKDQKITVKTKIDSLLKAGRMDSLDRSETVMYIEEVYGVDIWGKDLRTFDTFQDILDFVKDKQ